jgi:DNA-binding MarR family transcriptional regulator
VGAEEYACAQAWAALSAAHSRVAERLAADLARTSALSINEFEILLWLDRAPGRRQRLGELTECVPLTQPALSRAVTRMAERGLVAREGVPDDRRGVLIVMQSAGAETLGQAIPVHARAVREALLDHLSADEQRLLADLLRQAVSQPRRSRSANWPAGR